MASTPTRTACALTSAGTLALLLAASAALAEPANKKLAEPASKNLAEPANKAQAEPAAKAKPAAKAAANDAETLPGRKPMPKPANPSREETQHFGYLDDTLASLRNLKLSEADAERVRAAFKSPAGADESAISDPAARKLVQWARLRAGTGSAREYKAFLDANPAWPQRNLLIERLEQALFEAGGSSADLRRTFAAGEPETALGHAALATALAAEGKSADAKRLAAKAWRNYEFPAGSEAAFLARFKGQLTEADHRWRFDRLTMDDIRWSGERSAQAAIARRVIPLLSAPEQKKAQARIAVFMGGKALAALPADGAPDWGLVYHRVQALRRAGKTEDAIQLMLGAPTEEAKIVSPDGWWGERRALAYAALKADKPKLAYELVREAGPLSANPAKEQQFMAGWLALRYLDDAAKAEPHFVAFEKAADGPLSRAKARYWLGRTAEARGNGAAAKAFYRAAQEDADTFHAFLARQKLEPGRQAIAIKPPARPTDEEARRFVDLDAARATVIASRAKLDVSLLRNFIVGLRGYAKTEAESAMVAHLAEIVGDTKSAVRAAKAAIARGHNLIYYAYPVAPFPAYTALTTPPETAMLLGVARQETEFDTLTVSGAGAKGLLQVMTITAKHVCRDYKIKCDIPRLLSDPVYNTMMGSAYIGDRMREFSGSYVLTLAGYNAGPGRARQWIGEFGDPRSPGVDPIDWIERIPIQETREYVAKVLSNIQVYRARLGQGREALRLTEDLDRARLADRGTRPRKSGNDG